MGKFYSESIFIFPLQVFILRLCMMFVVFFLEKVFYYLPPQFP